jgi:hypothetical protein
MNQPLTPQQARRLASVAASHALDGQRLTEPELALLAELIAGRIDFDTYRRRCLHG